MKRRTPLLIAILLLTSALACRAAERLITGDGGDSSRSVGVTPTWDSATLEAAPQASCPDETSSIIRAANIESLPTSDFPNVDTGGKLDIPLVTYSVSGNQLSGPTYAKVPRNLLKYQNDYALQQSAWKLFADLIPADQRGMLGEFEIITDGPGGVLSLVEQTSEDPRLWVLEADIADIPDTKSFTFTLLHEFGHLLTLSPSQVPPDLTVFKDPHNTKVFEQASAACPDYFPGEGCSLPASYLNVFFNRYWKGLYEEWRAIDRIEDDDRRQSRLDAFYRKYRARFVDSYAVTSPTEDIAETWTYFILNPVPNGSAIADQKINFFYEYPELVSLRGQIRDSLCAANP